MSQLLLEYIPIDYDRNMIVESIREGKPVRVKALLQKANFENENGRVYPKEILMRESAEYIKDFVNQNRAVGELDHPDIPTVNLRNASHNIVEMRWEGDNLIGILEILTTPCGNIVRELMKSGIKLGISSRGVGSLRKLREGIDEVGNDYKLICFDIVSNPSTGGAFLYENKQHVITDKSQILEHLISEFICEINQSCQL